MYEKEFGKVCSQLDLPFQETKQALLKKIFKTLERKFDLQKNSKQIFIDLGSGNGQVIIYCTINYGIRSIGIEINPVLVKETKNSIHFLRKEKIANTKDLKKIKTISGDFYTHNLKKYDFIYIYSLPTMHKYLRHVFQTAKHGAIIISHRYPMENIIRFIEFKFKLVHNIQNRESATYFYRRF